MYTQNLMMCYSARLYIVCHVSLMCTLLALVSNDSSSLAPSQHLNVLLKWHPIREEMVSVDKEDRKSVFILLTKLKTLSLSAFEVGIDSSSRARVPKFQYLYAPIGDLVFRTFSQNFTASLSEHASFHHEAYGL